MNIKFTKKIIFTLLFLNFLMSGTVYLTITPPIATYYHATPALNSIGATDFFNETYALGYYHPVWKKRKILYNVNLGFEYMQNDNFNFLSFYTMLNYEPFKELTASFLAGLNFYNHENEYLNDQNYHPDSKGGQIYGLAVTYNANNKFPISIDYKVYTFSEVQSDIWYDFEYSRCGISLGYKF